MGDVSIANDILDALEEAMVQDVGKSLVLRSFTEGALDPANPGAGRPKTNVNTSVSGIISAYEEKRIDNTLVLKGDMEGLLSIKGLSITPAPGMRLIDGSIDYEIIRANIPELAGIGVVAILQLRR